MCLNRKALCLALFLGLGVAPGLTLAPVAAAEQRQISKGEAARLAQQRFGGEVLKVSRQGNGYLVKLLLPNGRVKSVMVDAASGRVEG